jgi:hypothetical protein
MEAKTIVCGYISNIYVDAANPEVWQALKGESSEPSSQRYLTGQIADCRKYNIHIEDRMIVVPVPFSIEGPKMLQHTKWLLDEKEEDGSSLIAIDKERFHKLLTCLSTAIANEYKLDNEQTSFNHILDAFRLSLRSIRGPNKIMSKYFVAISINDSTRLILQTQSYSVIFVIAI